MSNDYLIHHGIKGQRWGVRRFQNEDGSFTVEGKKRYGLGQKNDNAGRVGTITRESLARGFLVGGLAMMSVSALANSEVGEQLFDAGYEWVKQQRVKVLMNNIAVEIYAARNNIPHDSQKGIGLGIDAAKRGERFIDMLMNPAAAGKDHRLSG